MVRRIKSKSGANFENRNARTCIAIARSYGNAGTRVQTTDYRLLNRYANKKSLRLSEAIFYFPNKS